MPISSLFKPTTAWLDQFVAVTGVFFVLLAGSASAAEEKVLDRFSLVDDAGSAVLRSASTALTSQVAGDQLPYGFILPGAYCERADLLYQIEFDYQITRALAPKQRYGLLSLGVNVSGHDANSVSLVYMGNKALMARMLSSDAHDRAQILSIQETAVGKRHRIKIRVDSHGFELFLDQECLGGGATADPFIWKRGRPLYFGGETPRISRFPGVISDLSVTILQNQAEQALRNDSRYQALVRNPYAKSMLAQTKGALRNGPNYYIRLIADEHNDWRYRDMANVAAVVGYCYRLPHGGFHKSAAAKAYLNESIRYLCQVNNLNDWVSKKNGDPNINRFTLTPLLEAISFVYDDLPPETRELIAATLPKRIDNQMAHHGSQLKAVDDIYPNMDAFYALILAHGARLFHNARYETESRRVLQLLADSQYPDGAWPYIRTSNENISYHRIVVGSVARLYSLTKSPLALAMIKKSVPFYKLSVGPNLITDYATDVHWKHNWNKRLSAAGPDIVAGITGDRQNKWVAEHAVAGGGDPIAIYAAMFWQDMPSEPMPNDRVVLDRNVNGPRGHFRNWDWVASASYGSDTLVSCYSKPIGPSLDQLQGLIFVRAEIASARNPNSDEFRDHFTLGMPPPGSRGTTVINGTSATFAAEYQMECFRSLWGAPPYPQKWTCKQEWTLGPKEVTGEVQIVSDEKQSSPCPRIRLVFGKQKELVKEADNRYSYGDYRLSIEHSDFSDASVRSVSVAAFAGRKDDGRELLLKAGTGTRRFAEGETFTLKIRLTKKTD
jgi:hypothetical protein